MNIFAKKPTAKEAMRESKREVAHATRGIEREIGALQLEEKKLVAEIKRTAKTGNEAATKILARQLVRLRQQISNLQGSRAQMRGIATHTQQMEPAKQAKIIQEFQRQSAQMDMTSEMMSESIDDALDNDEAQEETEELTNQVLDEIGIDVVSQLSAAPKGRIAGKKTQDAERTSFEQCMCVDKHCIYTGECVYIDQKLAKFPTSIPNLPFNALYKTRFERDRSKKLLAWRRSVLIVESQIAICSKDLERLQLLLSNESKRLNAAVTESKELETVRRASVAFERVAASDRERVSKAVGGTMQSESRIRDLKMEIRLCRQQIDMFSKACVNNVGIGIVGSVEDVSAKEYSLVMATNLESGFHLSQLALPLMRHSGRGNIVFISSTVSATVTPSLCVYATTKGAINLLAKIWLTSGPRTTSASTASHQGL
ncbi:hypothetical protein QJS10_CPB18g02028 [Acorus calamus]|uniref:Uncharacterized protein n=1 Tax=Acorus calamus TaxID=4465 RepID=A0AAV9CPE9_ACOCL|nr:hypothetical protein QJS10_CPB18g02028 [Acorus calamus]